MTMKNNISFSMLLGANMVRVDADFSNDGSDLEEYHVYLMHDDGKRYDLAKLDLTAMYFYSNGNEYAALDIVEDMIWTYKQ
jgi:hypothetical protein